MEDDSALIERLGGPTRLAELLGYDKHCGGVQRVQNWISRGIPSKVKLKHPQIFLRELLLTSEAKPARKHGGGDV